MSSRKSFNVKPFHCGFQAVLLPHLVYSFSDTITDLWISIIGTYRTYKNNSFCAIFFMHWVKCKSRLPSSSSSIESQYWKSTPINRAHLKVVVEQILVWNSVFYIHRLKDLIKSQDWVSGAHLLFSEFEAHFPRHRE